MKEFFQGLGIAIGMILGAVIIVPPLVLGLFKYLDWLNSKWKVL
jgi:hypothetical protein